MKCNKKCLIRRKRKEKRLKKEMACQKKKFNKGQKYKEIIYNKKRKIS